MTSRTIYECDTCGDDVEENDVFNCYQCGCDLCSNCYRACYGCNEVFCGDDITYVESDDANYCDSCLPDYDENVPHDEDYGRFIERVPESKRDSIMTIGFEIEVDDNDADDRDVFGGSKIFVAHHHDISLSGNNQEWNTDALTTTRHIEELARLIERANIHDMGNAGGHIHVRRTTYQTASRWYWALKGLEDSQARALNMRHVDNSRWCSLLHGEYDGKYTAVNDTHTATIELRTFGAWTSDNTDKMRLAASWLRHMWHFFEDNERGSISSRTIMDKARELAPQTDTTSVTAKCAAYRAAKNITPRELHEWDRVQDGMRAAKRRKEVAAMRERVLHNVDVSRRARNTHGVFNRAEYAWNQEHKAKRRKAWNSILKAGLYDTKGEAMRAEMAKVEKNVITRILKSKTAVKMNSVPSLVECAFDSAHYGMDFNVATFVRDGNVRPNRDVSSVISADAYHRMRYIVIRRVLRRLALSGKAFPFLQTLTYSQLVRLTRRLANVR